MSLLLDTPALIWWLAGETTPSSPAREAIQDRETGIFATSVFASRCARNSGWASWRDAALLAREFEETVAAHGFSELTVTMRHARVAGALAPIHRPFDRLLIRRALVEDWIVVSNEQLFDGYGVRRLW